MSVTAIILNWKRPQYMPRILDSLRQSEFVSEIIVWNNNPDVHFVAEEDVFVVNASRDLGLFTRFVAASLAKNDAILLQDDDIILTESMIRTLFSAWTLEPDICHASRGRNCSVGPYNKINAWGEVDVVLTQAMMVHKRICLQAAVNTQILTGIETTPFGNGEDILISYTAMALSGKLNKAHHLFLRHEAQDPLVAISQRVSNHLELRSKVLERCRTLLTSASHC